MTKSVVIAGAVLTFISCALYSQRLELVAHDFLLQRHAKPPQSDLIAIVDIDEASLAQEGQWPWPRYVLADLTRKLDQAGAKVIAFDVMFPESDRSSPATLNAGLQRRFGSGFPIDETAEHLRDFDTLFATALKESQSILGCFMQLTPNEAPEGKRGFPRSSSVITRGHGDPSRQVPRALAATVSIPALASAAKSEAFINTLPDFDSLVRRTPLVWLLPDDRFVPSLALEAVRLQKGVDHVLIEHDERGITGVRIGEDLVPTDSGGRLTINFRKSVPGSSYPRFSAADVLNETLAGDALRGRIVFIGTSAAGLRDLRATPIARDTSGVEIQANVVDNLLSGDALQHSLDMRIAEFLAIILFGGLATLAAIRLSSWGSFAVTLVLILALVVLSENLFRDRGILFLPVHAAVAGLLIFPVLTTIRYAQRERREAWIRETFGAMVSPDVLTYLEEHAADLHTAGEEAEVSILFADVTGFSHIAETLDPRNLTLLTNEYLSVITEIILRWGGYVDKYVGDMVMAEWGVPRPASDHAERACRAALEIMSAMEGHTRSWRDRYGVEVRLRIGINSGKVVAGNMGSNQRFQYTVLGDAVNVAARLEPLNKTYGTSILISKATRDRVAHCISTRRIASVVVRGRTDEVEIFEPLAVQGEATT